MALKFDHTVSVGHIFTGLSMLIAAGTVFVELNNRVERVDGRVNVVSSRVSAIEARQNRDMASFQKSIDEVNQTLIRMDNRQRAFQDEIRRELQNIGSQGK